MVLADTQTHTWCECGNAFRDQISQYCMNDLVILDAVIGLLRVWSEDPLGKSENVMGFAVEWRVWNYRGPFDINFELLPMYSIKYRM